MYKMFILGNSKVLLRTVVRLSPSFVIPVFKKPSGYDQDILHQPQDAPPKTGFDRIKKMFARNEADEISEELHNVVQMSLCGIFFGACMGGLVKSRHAYVNFIENNQATIFKSTMEAKKKLQDQVTLAFARGAYYWGWRLGIFTGIFGLITTTISVYRDESSIVEYVWAGAVTGAIYKANLGPIAMMVGACLGGVLSLIGGLCILGILKVTGRSMEEIRASLYKIKQSREDQYNQAVEKAATEKHDELTMHHDFIIQEKGEEKVESLA